MCAPTDQIHDRIAIAQRARAAAVAGAPVKVYFRYDAQEFVFSARQNRWILPLPDTMHFITGIYADYPVGLKVVGPEGNTHFFPGLHGPFKDELPNLALGTSEVNLVCYTPMAVYIEGKICALRDVALQRCKSYPFLGREVNGLYGRFQ